MVWNTAVSLTSSAVFRHLILILILTLILILSDRCQFYDNDMRCESNIYLYVAWFIRHCGLGLIFFVLGLIENFWSRPRPHIFWPRPHPSLTSLTSLPLARVWGALLVPPARSGMEMEFQPLWDCLAFLQSPNNLSWHFKWFKFNSFVRIGLFYKGPVSPSLGSPTVN